MKLWKLSVLFGIAMLVYSAPAMAAAKSACIDCHKKVTPGVVKQHLEGKMSKKGVDCSSCHGSEHKTMDDAKLAMMPTPETCAGCHKKQTDQFKAGKHNLAWIASSSMPMMGHQPKAVAGGDYKGCTSCHKIGVQPDADKTGYRYGHAQCDSCHTRHSFKKSEAQDPRACQTCHMGFDHPQYEMYSASKHGVRYLLKQSKVLPNNVAAPTCQSCHMQNGQHEVRTAWGFLAVRLPMPENVVWREDRTAILQALGILDPTGKPTGRLDVVKGAQVARLTQEDWQKERDKMIKTCNECHSVNFAKAELAKGDQIIADIDHLTAEAIRTIASLYKDGVLAKPSNYAYPFPDLLTFQDAPTPIEQRLFVMFLEHRNRTFQGMFHNNPDYTWWYGYSELQRDLTEIKYMAQELRSRAGKSEAKVAKPPAKKQAK